MHLGSHLSHLSAPHSLVAAEGEYIPLFFEATGTRGWRLIGLCALVLNPWMQSQQCSHEHCLYTDSSLKSSSALSCISSTTETAKPSQKTRGASEA